MVVKEIRLHGRGGQGTVKASEAIVYAAVKMGLYGNSIPYFGFERKGAPVSAFVRISEQPIRAKTQVYRPQCTIVMDATVMTAVDVFEGMPAGGILIVNRKGGMKGLSVPPFIKTVGAVDATGISLELLGRAIPNTVMLGAFGAVTNWVDTELMRERVRELFDDRNADALMRGHSEVEIYELDYDESQEGVSRIGQMSSTKFHAPLGDDLYVLPTGDWRTHRPVVGDACTACGICLTYCPVGAIKLKSDPKAIEIGLQFCKGCGICARECPAGAIAMVEEGEKTDE